MNFRPRVVLFFSALALSAALPPLSAAPPAQALARVHWAGLDQIRAGTNSAHFISVWQLPPTAALVAQALDKISRLPGGGATNAAAALLRPLLGDFVSSEFYFELAAPAGSPFTVHDSQCFFALRLPAARACLWQTNLAAALEILTGSRPGVTRHGWLLCSSRAPECIEYSRDGDWTFVGLGLDGNISQSEFADRVLRRPAPAATNDWLEADFNPSCIADFFSRSAGGEGRGEVGAASTFNPQLSAINHVHLTALGDSGDVLTRATLDFSRPFPAPLPPWEIPTNLIHGPLTSFTAVRGLAAWLGALPAWQKIQLAPPPDQVYFWAKAGIPFQTYCAAPLPGAGSQLSQLAVRLVQNANPWLATNGTGNFSWQTNLPGIVWNDALIISPFLIPAVSDRRDYLLAGLYPFNAADPNPTPPEIIRAVLAQTNLLYYQTEQTGLRVDAGLFINQLFRVVFRRAQLPSNAAATVWLKDAEPFLGDSITSVIRTNPQQLDLTRYSTIGFTALELHLLADWLESPQFPCGLHTFLAPPDK